MSPDQVQWLLTALALATGVGAGALAWWERAHQDRGGSKTAAALPQSELRAAAFLQGFPGPAFISDAKGRILYANEEMERLLQHEASLRHAAAAGGRRRAPGRLRHDVETILRQGVLKASAEIELPDGGQWSYETLEFAIRRENAPPLIGGLALDVTETRRAEQERQELERRLRQTQKLEEIGLLTARVAHGLNNVLSPIIGYSDLALTQLPEDSPLRGDLEQIRKAAERAQVVTRQMLARKPNPARDAQPLSVNEQVAGFGDKLAELLPDTVAVDCRLAKDAGSIRADPVWLVQILTELVLNARDAIPGGGQLTIETAAITRDGQHARLHPELKIGPHVMLAVSDTGPGMDAAALSRVFEPFFTTKAKGQKSGFGLFNAYSAVREHGGTITVDSVPGRGTTVRVCLPQAADAPAAAAPASRALPGGNGSRTILVVEDEEAVRRFVCSTLQQDGYQVLDAGDGAGALRQAVAHNGPIDLLLTDVLMPGMSGKELHARLTELHPGLPVLYMSGYTEDVIARHGILEPGTHLLSKPFSGQALARRIHQLLAPG